MRPLQQGGRAAGSTLALAVPLAPVLPHNGPAWWSSAWCPLQHCLVPAVGSPVCTCSSSPYFLVPGQLLLGFVPSCCLRLVKFGAPGQSRHPCQWDSLGVLCLCSACMSASRPSWNAPHFRQSAGRAGARAPLCLKSFGVWCRCSRPPWTSCSSCRCILRWPLRCSLTSSSSLVHCSSIRCWTRVSVLGAETWAPLRKLNVPSREGSAWLSPWEDGSRPRLGQKLRA